MALYVNFLKALGVKEMASSYQAPGSARSTRNNDNDEPPARFTTPAHQYHPDVYAYMENSNDMTVDNESTTRFRATTPVQTTSAQILPRNHGSLSGTEEGISNDTFDDWEPGESATNIHEPLLETSSNRSTSLSPRSSSPLSTGEDLIRADKSEQYYYHRHRRRERTRRKKSEKWWKDNRIMARLIGGSVCLVLAVVFIITCWTNGSCAPRMTPKPPAPVCAPYSGRKLAIFETSIDRYVKNNRGNGAADMIEKKIAHRPMAEWIGDWEKDPKTKARRVRDMARAQRGMYTVVVYSIPNRDCGQHSRGGADNLAVYDEWITKLATGLQGHGGGIIILEPDALTLTDCLSEEAKADRFKMLKFAVLKLKAAGAKVYLDAGHANWLSPEEVSKRLNLAGVEFADGFALNTANSVNTDKSIEYGNKIVGLVGKTKGFVIDVSRNGAGAPSGDGESAWCNPPSLRLGQDPTLKTKDLGCHVHALLWVKPPGESDGTCGGNPSAGSFSPKLAEQLISS